MPEVIVCSQMAREGELCFMCYLCMFWSPVELKTKCESVFLFRCFRPLSKPSQIKIEVTRKYLSLCGMEI